MAETKPIGTTETTVNAGDRTIRSFDEAVAQNASAPPEPSQADADAIKEGTYGVEPDPPEGDTQEARKKREEAARKQREATAAAGAEGTYKTR